MTKYLYRPSPFKDPTLDCPICKEDHSFICAADGNYYCENNKRSRPEQLGCEECGNLPMDGAVGIEIVAYHCGKVIQRRAVCKSCRKDIVEAYKSWNIRPVIDVLGGEFMWNGSFYNIEYALAIIELSKINQEALVAMRPDPSFINEILASPVFPYTIRMHPDGRIEFIPVQKEVAKNVQKSITTDEEGR